MPWRIDFEGEVYREGDLTLEQIGRIENLLGGKSWLHIQPVKFAGDGIGVLAVMHADHTGKPIEDIVAQVGQLKADQYLNIIKIEDQDDLPAEYRDGFPPEAGEPPTGT